MATPESFEQADAQGDEASLSIDRASAGLDFEFPLEDVSAEPQSQIDIDIESAANDPTEGSGYAFDYWLEQKRIKTRQLRHKAERIADAMDGWQNVRSRSEWLKVCEEAGDEYYSGRFFLEQLGAERYLVPKLFATLWQLRNGLIEDLPPRTHADLMLIDLMLIGYHNTPRVQGWVGNLAIHIEREFFDEDGLSARFKKRYGNSREVESLNVERRLEECRVQMLPMLDRCNRMMLRNLKALQELRNGPTPKVSIGKAEQVDVAGQQVNKKG